MSFRELKIMVGVLDNGMWHSKFAKSLRAMEVTFRNYAVKGYPKQHLRSMVTTGSVLSKSRYETIKAAKTMLADYLVFIDSDQTFPPFLLHKWVEHDKDVMAANVATKQIPSSPTARLAPPLGSYVPVPVYTDPESKGLQEVWRVGTGILMLSKKVLQALPANCLEVRYVPEIDDYQGEDWSLCKAIQEAGFKIFIDHDMSKAVGHVGLFEYTHDVVGEIVQEPIPAANEAVA